MWGGDWWGVIRMKKTSTFTSILKHCRYTDGPKAVPKTMKNHCGASSLLRPPCPVPPPGALAPLPPLRARAGAGTAAERTQVWLQEPRWGSGYWAGLPYSHLRPLLPLFSLLAPRAPSPWSRARAVELSCLYILGVVAPNAFVWAPVPLFLFGGTTRLFHLCR